MINRFLFLSSAMSAMHSLSLRERVRVRGTDRLLPPHPARPSLYLSPRGGEYSLPLPLGEGLGEGCPPSPSGRRVQLSLLQLLSPDRQAPYPLAGGGKHGIRHGRGNGSGPRLADAT